MKRMKAPYDWSVLLSVHIAVLVSAGVFQSQAATDRYVWTSSPSPGEGYTNWDLAAHTIQEAIDAAIAGDTIFVTNGVYDTGGITNWPAGSTLTNRVSVTNAMIVKSVNGPAATIIKGAWDPLTNGPAAVRCVYMAANARLIGFTLTNGATKTSAEYQYDQGYAGGVCSADDTAIISNCLIIGNTCGLRGAGSCRGALYNCTLAGNSNNTADGGGAYWGILNTCIVSNNVARYWGGGVSQAASLSNCIITGNSTFGFPGGGVWKSTCYNCIISNNFTTGTDNNGCGGGVTECTLYNCSIIGNTTRWGSGGGVGDTVSGPSILYNCLIANNKSMWNVSYKGGGGVVGIGKGVYLYNCTVVSNYAASTNGGGVYVASNGTGTFVNCIIASNSAAGGTNNNYYIAGVASFTNTCTTPLPASGSRNITNDPRFAGATDYRLTQNSPCINMGMNQAWMTNSLDLDGSVRIRYKTVDMGAYEAIYEGSIYIIP